MSKGFLQDLEMQ